MHPRHVLNQLLNTAPISRSEASRRIGRSSGFINSTVTNKSIPKVDTLAAIAEVCGYHLVLIPHNEGVPNNSIVIDPEN